jgi:ribonuclease E
VPAGEGEGHGEREGGRRRRRRGGRDRGEDRGPIDAADGQRGEAEIANGGEVSATRAAPSSRDVPAGADDLGTDEPVTREATDGTEAGAEETDRAAADGKRRRRRRGGRRDEETAGGDQAESAGSTAGEGLGAEAGADTPEAFSAIEGDATAQDPAVRTPAGRPPVAPGAAWNVAGIEAAAAPEPTPVRAAVQAEARAEAQATPQPAPMPERAQPASLPRYELPKDELERLAREAGLEWVGSDAGKVQAAQAAMAAEPQPIHVPRDPKPVVLADEGPLVLVETLKDLSQLKLPFETAPPRAP